MADAYLNVAERVIQTSRRPLRPREIIQTAYVSGLLPWHLHGATQHKTLQARISEDLSRNPEASVFFRTGPGIFFLKQFLSDPSIPDALKQPYYAPPRRKTLRRERVLAVKIPRKFTADPFRLWPISALNEPFDRDDYSYVSYSQIAELSETAIVYSYVLVFHGDEVLSYKCGKFAPSTDPLYGRRSIGLGGAVYAGDRDLLFETMHGIIGSGINELGYGIGLPRQLAEQARYENQVKACLCTLLEGDEIRPPIIHVILGYECPPEFAPSKAALSINDLRWVSIKPGSHGLADYDETSRRLYSSGVLSRLRKQVAAHVSR